MAKFVVDPETGGWIEAHLYAAPDTCDLPAIQGDIEPFKSPIDGTLITSRSQLRRHHAQHGTTDHRDYSPEFKAAKAKQMDLDRRGQTPQARLERIELIKHVIETQQRR